MKLNIKDLGSRLRKYRTSLGLTQRDVGKYLGVSYQQVQRYESGEAKIGIEALVKLSGLFKISLDTLVFGEEEKDEASSLIEKLPRFKGRRFQITKLIHMILFFATTCQLNKTKLNKLLFYSDFLHFKKEGKPISDVPYVVLPHGPAPESYNAILGILQETGYIEITEKVINEDKGIVEEQITAESFNRKLFDEKEFEVLRKVALHLGGKTGAELSKLAHNEPFWKKLDLGKPIDYKLAKKLKVEL